MGETQIKKIPSWLHRSRDHVRTCSGNCYSVKLHAVDNF